MHSAAEQPRCKYLFSDQIDQLIRFILKHPLRFDHRKLDQLWFLEFAD